MVSPMCALILAFALIVAAFAPAQSHAKGTGLIFVSNEKTNNLIVIDPKTYQVVKDIKSLPPPARHALQRRPYEARMSPAAMTT